MRFCFRSLFLHGGHIQHRLHPHSDLYLLELLLDVSLLLQNCRPSDMRAANSIRQVVLNATADWCVIISKGTDLSYNWNRCFCLFVLKKQNS